MGKLGVGAALAASVVAYLKYKESITPIPPGQSNFHPTFGTYAWGALAGFALGYAGADIAELVARIDTEKVKS